MFKHLQPSISILLCLILLKISEIVCIDILYISQYYTNSLTGLKQVRYVCAFGLCLVIMGEVIRKASMITASTNFNHYVQYRKQQDHQLVTHGIYAWSRHPSYVGWFLWSVGTQVIR